MIQYYTKEHSFVYISTENTFDLQNTVYENKIYLI